MSGEARKDRPEMSEFYELVASPGVFAAGRFGADGRVAEHKTTGLYVENPALTGIASWFCAAVTTMFGSRAYAVDKCTATGS
jgi:roadblock/LC7 domain-containing protein